MDEVMMTVLVGCIILSLSLRVERANERIDELAKVAVVDTVYVVALPDSIPVPALVGVDSLKVGE